MKRRRCHLCGRTPAEGRDYRTGAKPICHDCFNRIVATQGAYGEQAKR